MKLFITFKPFKASALYHVQTSQYICITNQLSDLYMIGKWLQMSKEKLTIRDCNYHKISLKISAKQKVKVEIRLIKFFALASLTKSSYI